MRQTMRDWYETGGGQADSMGVLLLHSAWGLTGCYRQMADRLAAAGFHVVAPDMYGGEVADSWDHALALRAQRRASDRWTAIELATAHLRRSVGQHAPIGVVGLAMGGHWALFLAQRSEIPVAAATVFYAARGGDYRSSRAAFQFHLAAVDEWVSPNRLERLRMKLELAHRPAEYHVYPGTRHWFCDREHIEAYDAAAAELALRRTQDFLSNRLMRTNVLA